MHPVTQAGIPRGQTFYSEDMPPLKEEDVAVKKLRAIKLTPGLDKSQTTKSMLRRLKIELQVWMRLNHPNIAPLLGFNFADEIAIISPWFGNGNIADYLMVHSEADKVELLRGVTAGVCYLHSLVPVIVHGDLKPDNVLIDRCGRPKLIDFGLSKIVEEEPGLSSVLPASLREAGNARWIAPELLWEENASRSVQTDIFSFGCVAFFILTGDIPFKNTPDGQLVIARYKGAYPTPEIAVYRELSTRTALIAVLRSCWSTDPGGRPSMDDIARLLNYNENRLHLPLLPNGVAAPFIPWLLSTSAPEISLQLSPGLMEERTNTPAQRRSRSTVRKQWNSFKAFFRRIFKSEGGNS
ncbi:hypothetical protein FS837_005029 [Tulasnella sp. UAMH 9824]|nr:hypothetical protein FS837_005029 [Tulasnella sp. UAMH 9824]